MTRVISGDTLALKLSESLAARRPQRTRRDVRLPRVPNKALAVIGVALINFRFSLPGGR